MSNTSLRRVILASVALSLLFLASCSTPEQNADSAMSKIVEKNDVIGVAAVVVKNNEIIYNKSFGVKSLEDSTLLSETDIFRIASISKSFTATALMQLVEQGKISLDDDVSNLIGFSVRSPYFPDKVITLKMILSHTSSLSDAEGYFTLDHINPAVSGDCKGSYNEWEPGSDYQYCNLGFNLAGAILEKVSGVRFDEYVKKNVIEKLGLYGGHNVDSLDAARFVPLYEYEDSLKSFIRAENAYKSRSEEMKTYIMGYSTPIFSPTGGVKISATDLAKYMMMHINHGEYNGVRIISEESSRLMQSEVWRGEKDIYGKGYGLAIRTFSDWIPNTFAKGHTGSAYGLYSVMIFHPQQKWGIVVMTNGCDPEYIDDENMFLRSSVRVLYKALIK